MADVITGVDKEKLSSLLLGNRYRVNDEYQREYKWGKDQIEDLLQDFLSSFSKDRKSSYFLGTVILANGRDKKDGTEYKDIVDGQQRFTTISLLLISLLQKFKGMDSERSKNFAGQIRNSIYEPDDGGEIYVIDVAKRNKCFKYLMDQKERPESEEMENINSKYEQINEEIGNKNKDWNEKDFQDFTSWLLKKVFVVVITVGDPETAFDIFEVMNDRGLHIDDVEKMKGYILTRLEMEKRDSAKEQWTRVIDTLRKEGKDEAIRFVRSWFQGKYANNSGHGKKIGAAPYKWLKRKKGKNSDKLTGMDSNGDSDELTGTDSNGDSRFINKMEFYSKHFITLRESAGGIETIVEANGFEKVYYNAHLAPRNSWEPLLLSTLREGEDKNHISGKIKLLSEWLDIVLARRIWASESIGHIEIREVIYPIMKQVRDANESSGNVNKSDNDKLNGIREILTRNLKKDENKAFTSDLIFWGSNRKKVKAILIRLGLYIQIKSGKLKEGDLSFFKQQVGREHEIEHILLDDYKKYGEPDGGFEDSSEFSRYRAHVGALLVFDKTHNASLNHHTYAKKLPTYLAHGDNNPLAKSFHVDFYNNIPQFKTFNEQLLKDEEVHFMSYETFGKEQIVARDNLYRILARQIWDPKRVENFTPTTP